MGDDKDQGLMSRGCVACSETLRSGCFSQLKVCHSKARLMHRAIVASVSPRYIQSLRLVLTATVNASHALRNHTM